MNEQLKQAIEEAFAKRGGYYSKPLVAYKRGVEDALSTPSLLRHADPVVMGQAGWVRKKEEVSETPASNWACYEIHRANMPYNGCSSQCEECRIEQEKNTTEPPNP